MDTIQSLIAACQWDAPRFLTFSSNVFDPLIYYSHLVPLILSLIIGGFVFLKSRHLLLSRVLLVVTLLFAAWSYFDLILWATDKPHLTIFFWSMQVLIEPIIYAAMAYFVYVFIHNADSPLWHKLVIGALLLPTILLAPTHYALLGYDLTNCDREAIEGPLAHYGYVIEVLFTAGILAMAAHKVWREKDKIIRREVFLVAAGSVLFLAAFSWGNIVGTVTDDWRIPQWGLFGMPVFLAFLSYLIVKFRLFEIKLIATQALVFALAALIGSQFFFIRTFENRILNSLTFGVAVIAGVFLVRSVKKEVEQRVEIQGLAKNLENTLHFISHDVKGALAQAHGTISEVLEGDFGGVSPELGQVMAKLDDGMKKTIDMTTTVLKARDAKTGRIQYDMKPFDLKQALMEAVEYVKPQAQAKNLSLEVTVPQDIDGTVVGDRGLIAEHVLRNLLANAVIYTPQGSVHVTLTRQSGSIRVSVKDSGVGITPEDKARLFTEGGKGKDSTKTNVHSTGYGLYLAKTVVDAHHGRIWAESEGPGKGSTFVVEFPASEAASR